jgi:DNA-nicking Smr family endonuclease
MITAILVLDPMDEADDDIPIDVPIDGTLDLHTFQPRDVKELVPDYLAECRERGILEVRIIHGKGTGALRRTVHAILSRLPEVASFGLALEDAGGWGATLVTLRAPAEDRGQHS